MNKVLILSCSTGQGHDSCARAVAEYFELQGVHCEIRDALDFISRGVAKCMSKGHSMIYRHMPGVFRWGYHYSEEHASVFEENSGVYRLLTAGTDRMYEFISDGGYDTIICTHVFSALILTHMLREHPIPVKTAFVATDYTCSPSLEVSDLQYYFIPEESLAEEFVRQGIAREKIIATGIPVSRNFLKNTEADDAKRLLGIRPENRHLLLMCGSMGCGPIREILRNLEKNMTPDMEVSVICGTNKKLRRHLERCYELNDRIHIVGYTRDVALYMDSADLYLTKPGGLSVSEAAAKELPMAFINAVAGCESHNLEFFVEKGAAVTAPTAEELAEKSIRVLFSCNDRKTMKTAMEECHFPDAAGFIYETLIGEVKNEQKQYC